MSTLQVHFDTVEPIRFASTCSVTSVLNRTNCVFFVYVDWTCMGNDIGSALIKWIYTDQVDFSKGEDFTLELIKIANEYRLEDLISK